MAARGIAVAITALAACVLAIISVATPLYLVERTVYTNIGIPINQKVKYTAWEICTESTLGTVAANSTANNADCTADFDCFSDEVRVIRAFGILTIAMTFVVFIFGVIDVCEALPSDPWGKLLLTLLTFCALIFAIICFSLQVSLWSNDCAGMALEDTEGARWGVAPILAIVASGLLFVGAMFALFIPGAAFEEDQVAVSPAEAERSGFDAPAYTDGAAAEGASAGAAAHTERAPYGYSKGDGADTAPADGVVVGQPVQQGAYMNDQGYYVEPHAPSG